MVFSRIESKKAIAYILPRHYAGRAPKSKE